MVTGAYELFTQYHAVYLQGLGNALNAAAFGLVLASSSS